jgi:hypothetical protein
MGILASELRVGNWVEAVAKMGNYNMRVTVHNFVSISEGPECCNPIPLTPEILAKAGLIKIENKIDIYEIGRIRFWVGSRGQTLVYLIEESTTRGHYIRTISFVHEVQNVVYWLYGEELPINFQ